MYVEVMLLWSVLLNEVSPTSGKNLCPVIHWITVRASRTRRMYTSQYLGPMSPLFQVPEFRLLSTNQTAVVFLGETSCAVQFYWLTDTDLDV